jgi:hypothetical protein
MAKQFTIVDNFQTKFSQSFVDLTALDSTTYPAITTVSLDQHEMGNGVPPLSVYNIYRQYALRTKAS